MRTSDHYTGQRYYEVGEDKRRDGSVFHLIVVDDGEKHIGAEPLCIRGCCTIEEDIGPDLWKNRTSLRWDRTERGNEFNRQIRAAAKAAIEKSRNCKAWIPYQRGRDPLLLMEFLMFAELSERLEKSRQTWETEMENKRSQTEKHMHRINKRIAWIGVLFAFLQVAAAAITLVRDQRPIVIAAPAPTPADVPADHSTKTQLDISDYLGVAFTHTSRQD